jgi:mandelamide amidase
MTRLRAPAPPPGVVEGRTGPRLDQPASYSLTERMLDTALRHADLNPMITVDAEESLRAAWQADRDWPGDGPLRGIPMVINDNIHVAGMPNTAGTPALANFVPPEDAPVVSSLRGAGAFVLGKSNMHELSVGVTGGESMAGAVHNARDSHRLAGGSSAGAAVMVALGIPAALGVDFCGSARIPAALNGVCALRPSAGRYSMEAITPLSSSRGTVAPMAATVADLAVLDSVLAGELSGISDSANFSDTLDADTLGTLGSATTPRLGVPVTYRSAHCDRATLECFEKAVDRLRSKGVVVVEVATFPLEGVERRIGIPILAYEFRRELIRYLRTYLPSLTLTELAGRITGTGVRQFFQRHILSRPVGAITHENYDAALAAGRAELLGYYRNVFRTHQLDALVYPTVPRQPSQLELRTAPAPGARGESLLEASPTDLPELAEEMPTVNAHAAEVFTRHTAPGSIVGLPGLTLPVPTGDGPAVGLGLDGPPGGDRALLALGRRLERLLR